MTTHTDHLSELSLEVRDNILKDEDFSIPPVDLSKFDLPADLLTSINDPSGSLTEGDLTQRIPKGTGMFDAIMEATAAHLKEEYEANRITGAEYSKAYAACLSSSLQGAISYLTAKDTAYWQGITARANAAKSLLEYEAAKYQLLLSQLSVAAAKADYATKIANLASIEADYDIKRYQLETTLPAQAAQITAQTAQVNQQVDIVIPKQIEQLEAQTKLVKEQTEAERAKTLDNRSDGLAVAGSMGMSNALHQQQITSYQRHAEVESAKLFTDNVVTQLTVDPATPALEGTFTKFNIRKVLDTIMTNNGFGERVPASDEK